MNIQKLIESMDRFQTILPVLLRELPIEDLRWKPESGNWSILEVLCHLHDEEKDDFRPRVQSILTDPSLPLVPWDPEGTAISRRYNEQDPESELNAFLAERRTSLEYLRGLERPDWSLAFDHPKFGPLTAGMVMAGWAAHDQMHLRQITKRLFEMNQRDCAPFVTDYGGEWKA
ncbi:MAG: DinB family protein [Planctomycetota bacterium]